MRHQFRELSKSWKW